jgi:hypothetical protein
MSTWNFRLLDLTDENNGEPYLELVEVYYTDAGEPVGYCKPCTGSETIEGLKQLVAWFALALDKPVIQKSEFVERRKEEASHEDA